MKRFLMFVTLMASTVAIDTGCGRNVKDDDRLEDYEALDVLDQKLLDAVVAGENNRLIATTYCQSPTDPKCPLTPKYQYVDIYGTKIEKRNFWQWLRGAERNYSTHCYQHSGEPTDCWQGEELNPITLIDNDIPHESIEQMSLHDVEMPTTWITGSDGVRRDYLINSCNRYDLVTPLHQIKPATLSKDLTELSYQGFMDKYYKPARCTLNAEAEEYLTQDYARYWSKKDNFLATSLQIIHFVGEAAAIAGIIDLTGGAFSALAGTVGFGEMLAGFAESTAGRVLATSATGMFLGLSVKDILRTSSELKQCKTAACTSENITRLSLVSAITVLTLYPHEHGAPEGNKEELAAARAKSIIQPSEDLPLTEVDKQVLNIETLAATNRKLFTIVEEAEEQAEAIQFLRTLSELEPTILADKNFLMNLDIRMDIYYGLEVAEEIHRGDVLASLIEDIEEYEKCHRDGGQECELPVVEKALEEEL